MKLYYTWLIHIATALYDKISGEEFLFPPTNVIGFSHSEKTMYLFLALI